MFSLTKVSFVTVQNVVIDLKRYFPWNKFKRGSVSKKWWSANHGLLATDTLALLLASMACYRDSFTLFLCSSSEFGLSVFMARMDNSFRVYCSAETDVRETLCGKWTVHITLMQ
jgi:hypothetical protein